MLDGFGREIDYLRVSVTDRCNLRCRYCMPTDGIEHLAHNKILSLEEIERIIKVAASIGIKKVRLTGGEPLIRRNFTQLIRYIKKIEAIDDIAITTNGLLFSDLAVELKEAGVTRVNISLDTLRPQRFSYMTRGGNLETVKRAIETALALGFHPVKLNVVVIRGFNDDELLDFARMAYELPLHIRFIEFMPVGDLLYWKKDRMISAGEICQRIESGYVLEPREKIRGNGPARYFDIRGGQGSIGFIDPISNHFCGECNRLRLTADGRIRACLYDRHETNLKQAILDGASDNDVKALLQQAIERKPEKHNMDSGWGIDNRRKMYQIGG